MVSLFKRHFQLLESSHHRSEQNESDEPNLEGLLGKFSQVLTERPNRDLARTLEWELFAGQHEHQRWESGYAEQIYEEQPDSDDRTKDLQEGQRRQPEGEKTNDVGGDGDHQGNGRQHGSLANRTLAGFFVEIPERKTTSMITVFFLLELFSNPENNVQSIIHADGQQKNRN